jgi:ribosomal protein S18 acetylase RimI-like enzyme
MDKDFPQYEIARVLPHSAERICRLLTANLPEWFANDDANQRYAEGCLTRTSFTTKIQGEFVGMLTLEFPFPNNANIYWMAVAKEYHGKHIGSQLIEAAVAYCI